MIFTDKVDGDGVREFVCNSQKSVFGRDNENMILFVFFIFIARNGSFGGAEVSVPSQQQDRPSDCKMQHLPTSL